MPKKIIAKIASHVESVRTTLVEKTVPETLSKAKKVGGTVAEGATKVSKNATETFSSVKENATTVVTTGIKQVSELEWKKEFEKFKARDLPLVSSLRPIDWTAEHAKFWDKDKAAKELEDSSLSDSQAKQLDEWTSTEPHTLVTGAGGSGKTVSKVIDEPSDIKDADIEELTESSSETSIDITENTQTESEVAVETDELVYTSASEGFKETPAIIITGQPGGGKGKTDITEADNYDGALKVLHEAFGVEPEAEEEASETEDSKAKAEKPAAKKAKAVSKDPVVTVLGTGEGEVEPLGAAYKKLVRKVAKQAEKNPDVKLYLSGKTFGIGARGTAEKIDGNDVSVFNAKDIKKLLAKIS